jgi:hypothetical protein
VGDDHKALQIENDPGMCGSSYCTRTQQELAICATVWGMHVQSTSGRFLNIDSLIMSVHLSVDSKKNSSEGLLGPA